MDKERQQYQLHQKGYEDITKAISNVGTNVSISIDGADAEKIEIESPKGDPGTNGENGKDGTTPVKGVDYFTSDEVDEITKDILKSIPKPKDGVNGKDAVVDYERINKFVRQEVSKIPKPKDGMDGFTPKIDYDSITTTVLKKIPAVDYPTIYEHVNKQVERAQSSMPRVLNSAGPTTRLSELSDVDTTGITNGQVLSWNGTKWIATTVSNGAVTSVNTLTGAVVLTTANIADSANKRYVTDANLTTIGNQSGTNTGNQTITLTSDVTGSGTGSFAATIATAAVTNAKMANMATKTYKGRTSAATGVPEDVAVATLKTDLSLNNVDNTSDANKPVSTATQTALNLKANLAGANFTGAIDVQGGAISTGGDGTNTGALVLKPANGAFNFYAWVNKEIGGNEGIALQRGAYPTVTSTPLTISAAGTAVFAGNVTSAGSNITGGGTFVSTSAGLIFLGATGLYYNMGISVTAPSTVAVGYSFARSVIGNATVTKAASGTHPLVASSAIKPMTISGSGSTITNTATQYIENAMTGGTNNYALWVDDGTVRIDGDIENITQTLTDSSTKVASTAFVQGNKIGYVMQTSSPSGFVALDSTTVFFSFNQISSPTYFPGMLVARAGNIKYVLIKLRVTGTLGTAEDSTVSIRINDTTDTVLSAFVKWNSAVQTLGFPLNIPVNLGDDICIKINTPAWSTNPTLNQLSSVIYIE
jgi:hypothetical protein